MSFTVVLMPLARRQAARIDAWWRQHRPLAPEQFDQDLRRLLASLTQHPDRGFARPRGRRALLTARTRHRAVYRVLPRAKRVEVLAITAP
ncbi:MAG: type II toxin-antitoxin system RelE/ParE family toxin [Myxococcales bacterium]|nr:type II toxin-antitoxin system RelE/ParE family toxin [Myxococcales bacterium]